MDRLEQWLASGEGRTIPADANTNLLVQDGDRYVARIEFLGEEWHVVPVLLGNKFDAEVDLSESDGFQLTYSATADLYVQIRPASHWDGGDKYLTRIPSTGGQIETRVFSFAAETWTTLPELGTPSYPLADALEEVRGLVFVGRDPNEITFYGLRFDGYVPSCT